MYPSNQDYKIALMIGPDSFRTLEQIEVIPNPSHPNEPWFATGGLAIVFKVKYQNKLYALKCFTKEVPEREERLYEISKYLKQNPSDYFVDFNYYENEIWIDNEEGGKGYPVVLMEWVEGLTLDNYLKEKCASEDKQALKMLYDSFFKMAIWLQKQPIAHGDLRHDNILILKNGKFKLIDYDGIFIPQFEGLKSNELGSPNYQHPIRSENDFNKHLDDFSLIVLQATLTILQQKPNLFFEHFDGEGILFRKCNFINKDFDLGEYNIKTTHYVQNIINQLIILLDYSTLSTISYNLKPLIDLDLFINDNSELSRFFKFYNELDEEFCDFSFLINIISAYYPLNHDQISIFSNKINWELLGENENIIWTEEFVIKNKEKFNWQSLLKIPIIKDHNLISILIGYSNSNFYDKWFFIDDYDDFRLKGAKVFNRFNFHFNQIPDSYKDSIRWDWINFETENFDLKKWEGTLWYSTESEFEFWTQISENKKINWDLEFINKYKDFLNWDSLSNNENLPWSHDLLNIYRNQINWTKLSSNVGVPWSFPILNNFYCHLNWQKLSDNKGINWNKELLKKYYDKWDWKLISKNYPWDIYSINDFIDKIDWTFISRNTCVTWTEDLIINNIDKLDHEFLLLNKSIFWNEKLLELIIEKGKSVNFSEIFYKQKNWSPVFIKKIANYLIKTNKERNTKNDYIFEDCGNIDIQFFKINIPLNLDIFEQFYQQKYHYIWNEWKHINLILNEEFIEYLISNHYNENLIYYLSENTILNWDYNSLGKMLPFLDNFKLSKNKSISNIILPFLNEEIVNCILHLGELKIREYTPWSDFDV